MARERTNQNFLDLFFEPNTVAVIGSLKGGLFGGSVVIRSLLHAGYSGQIFPVNPSYREAVGFKVYPSIQAVPETIDLAFVITAARSVPGILKECVAKRVRAAIVVSDGFAERDEEGKRLQEEIVAIAQNGGIRILGPNTAGVANPSKGFIPNPYAMGYEKVKPGAIAIGAQTGMINPQAFPYGDLHYGVSKICDFGNKADVDECDLMEYLEGDPDTRVVSLYIEGIRDGRRFLRASRRLASKKPVLVLKSGRTTQGAAVSASHTGSLAVDDRIFDGACAQAGVIRINTFRELFELPKIFAFQPLPRGNRLGIVTFTGGVGVLAIDEGTPYGLTIPLLSSETRRRLNEIFPGMGRRIVDVGPAMAVFDDYMPIYSKILKTVMADSSIDSVFNVLWTGPSGEFLEEYVRIYRELPGIPKPVATWVYGPRTAPVQELTRELEDLGFPVFPEMEMAIKSLALAWQYAKRKGGKG
ncbi:MAG: CoA-binding protein [Desulfobacterota bacterium]|nr:CoA-binding protein [Thermodesulfobacteriota bacterium]